MLSISRRDRLHCLRDYNENNMIARSSAEAEESKHKQNEHEQNRPEQNETSRQFIFMRTACDGEKKR